MAETLKKYWWVLIIILFALLIIYWPTPEAPDHATEKLTRDENISDVQMNFEGPGGTTVFVRNNFYALTLREGQSMELDIGFFCKNLERQQTVIIYKQDEVNQLEELHSFLSDSLCHDDMDTSVKAAFDIDNTSASPQTYWISSWSQVSDKKWKYAAKRDIDDIRPLIGNEVDKYRVNFSDTNRMTKIHSFIDVTISEPVL